jgi:hypothetical protein
MVGNCSLIEQLPHQSCYEECTVALGRVLELEKKKKWPTCTMKKKHTKHICFEMQERTSDELLRAHCLLNKFKVSRSCNSRNRMMLKTR